jgi:hypothetical protein
MPAALLIALPPPATTRRGHPGRRHLHRCLASDSTHGAAVEEISRLDALLSRGDDAGALSLAGALKASGVLRAFGAAQQVPKRAYTIEELRLNKIETREFLAPEDATLNGVRNLLQASFLAGLTAVFAAAGFSLSAVLPWALAPAALLTADQIANGGGVEALLVDAAGRVVNQTYARRVALHEAGHFLVAYLLGLLPRGYELSAWDAFRASRALNVQAGTTFCDAAFQAEVASGRLSSASLDVYSCVALAGVATEWIRCAQRRARWHRSSRAPAPRSCGGCTTAGPAGPAGPAHRAPPPTPCVRRYGRAEGGLADVQQLDRLLQVSPPSPTPSFNQRDGLAFSRTSASLAPTSRACCLTTLDPTAPSLSVQALGFTQAKADSQVRWAVLNTVTLLRRHRAAHDALADAMDRRLSVGQCVAVLERALEGAAP